MTNFKAMLAEFKARREGRRPAARVTGGVRSDVSSTPLRRYPGRTLIRVILRPRLFDVGLVALGGALGSLARVGVSMVIGDVALTFGFPLATLVVNVIGSFALGALVAVATVRNEARWRRLSLLLGTGLLGGFTTYSLFAADLATSVLDARFAWAICYAVGTVIGGTIASGLGMLVGRRIARKSGPPAAALSEVFR